MGNVLGAFVESDGKTMDGNWITYMLSLNVRKLVKWKMKIKKAGGEWSLLNFRYI